MQPVTSPTPRGQRTYVTVDIELVKAAQGTLNALVEMRHRAPVEPPPAGYSAAIVSAQQAFDRLLADGFITQPKPPSLSQMQPGSNEALLQIFDVGNRFLKHARSMRDLVVRNRERLSPEDQLSAWELSTVFAEEYGFMLSAMGSIHRMSWVGPWVPDIIFTEDEPGHWPLR